MRLTERSEVACGRAFHDAATAERPEQAISFERPVAAASPERTAELERAIANLVRAAPRCAIAGAVGAAGGLADVIAFVHQNRWSGTLAVADDGALRQVRFVLGEVRGAASSRAHDRLGELLFRYGRIGREELQRALAIAGRERRLGQVLIELGLLGTHYLFVFVKKQVEEIFFSLLGLRSGSYTFERLEDHEVDESLPDLGLSTRQLLFEGARLMDELLYFKERIPSAQVVPVHRPSAQNLVPLDEEVRLVLSLVDGVRSVEVIGRESQLGEIEATRVLFQLISAGRIELRRDAAGLMGEPRGGPERLVDFINRFLADVEATLAASGAPELLRGELRSFVHNTTKYAELFRGLDLEGEVYLSPATIAANLSRVPEGDRLAYLQRGLHELLCFLLFVVGDAVGIRHQQQLSLRLLDANRALERDNRRYAEGRGEVDGHGRGRSRAEDKVAVLFDDGSLQAACGAGDLESA